MIPGWIARAACAGMPTPVFFPEGKGSSARPALDVCERCPVRVECGQFALAEGFADGVFGGMTPEARRQARRDDRAA